MTMRASYLACIVGVLLAGSNALGSAANEGPSIEEMLAAVSDLEADGTTPRPTEARSSTRKPLPLKLTSHTIAETKKLERWANWTYSKLKQHRVNWEVMRLFIRLEKFEKAALTLMPMLKSRDPGPGQWRTRADKLGYFELEYAQIMTYLGQEKTAAAMMKKHEKMLEQTRTSRWAEEIISDGTLKYLRERRELIGGLPDILMDVEALQDALRQEPNGDTQWELVRICDPWAKKANLGLTWITATLEMIARYPDHRRVTGGDAQWTLQRAYRHHRMYDEALAVLDSYPKDFPESERTADHDAAWEFAYAHRTKGDFLKMVRERQEAGKSWKKSLELFRKFLGKYPKDSRCERKKGHDDRWWSRIDGQIRDLKRRLDR